MNTLGFYPMNGLNYATGYGRLEIALNNGLLDAGVTVRCHRPGDVNLIVGNPEWAAKLDAMPCRWLYTMSEADKVSARWVSAMNRYYERVFVPCPDLRDIYRDSGVTVPVHYIPLGVDQDAPPLVERNPNPETFTVLTYSLGDMRKGAELAILAFKRCFNNDPRYRLVIKCRDDANWLRGIQDEQITVVQGEQSNADWHHLLCSANVFIFASRGEGFGLPPREAVLSGLPTLATEALGMWDVESWGYPLPVKEKRPAQFDFWEANEKGSMWWEPEGYAIDCHLKAIASDYPAALKKATAGRDYMLQLFTWNKVIQRWKAWLDDRTNNL